MSAQTMLRMRHYWSGGHTTYRNCSHQHASDDPIAPSEVLATLLVAAGVVDGQAYLLTIQPLDDVDTAGRWELTEPHHYERVERSTPDNTDGLVSP